MEFSIFTAQTLLNGSALANAQSHTHEKPCIDSPQEKFRVREINEIGFSREIDESCGAKPIASAR